MKIYRLIFSGLILLTTLQTSAQTAMNFDGTNDYVQTTFPGISGNNDRSIEAWIKCPTVAGQMVITDFGTFLVTGGRFAFGLIDGYLRVEVSGNGHTGTILLGDNQWHHVAVTYKQGGPTPYTTYVDGVLADNFGLTVPLNTVNSVDMRIGVRTDTLKYFNGSIDEVRVWDDVRTETEINTYKNLEFCTPPANLVAYYKLNEGVANGNNNSVTSILDESGGSYDGFTANMALTGTSSNWVADGPIVGGYNLYQTLLECNGYSITVGTSTYNSTGSYSDVLTSVTGCDSVINTNLTVSDVVDSTQTIIECEGYSITVGGNSYNTTGINTDILTSVITGCDSIVTTDLTILNNSTSTVSETALDQFISPSGLYTWTTTGVYNDTLTNMAGCDSIIVVDLELDFSGIQHKTTELFSVYPNPTNGVVTVNGINELKNVTSITVTNSAGVIVLIGNPKEGKLDLSQLANGIYIVNISRDQDIAHIRVVKK